MYKTIAPLVLASQSPRRRDFLQQMGIEFTSTSSDIEELQFAGESAADFVSRMALEKALAVAAEFSDSWILSADTIVVLDDKILGKPVDKIDAIRMLTAISGNWHRVLTAFTLHQPRLQLSISRRDCSWVKIAALLPAQIKAYIDTGEPLDKAGSYAVQGIGGAFVESIEGSPTTVIGLPLPLVVLELLKYEIITI